MVANFLLLASPCFIVFYRVIPLRSGQLDGQEGWTRLARSPVEGSSVVLSHLDELLACLGAIHPWDKARFFLVPQPLFDGRTPLDAIRDGTPSEIERLKDLAGHYGEIGA